MENIEPQKFNEENLEEETDDGLGLFVKQKVLYHGSGISGIQLFNRAEENTVGAGIYLTSKQEDAAGYAFRSSKEEENKTPVVYEVALENIKLLDLRKQANVNKILAGFKDILTQRLGEPDLKWYTQNAITIALETIESGSIGPGNLRDATWSFGELFSEYVQTLGYAGLVTFEGGERGYVSDHESYVIFDTANIKIRREIKAS